MKSLINFLRYDNAVPILLGIVFLGAGSAFAASNPEAIFSTTEQVFSIDNTYLVNKDFLTYSPSVEIRAVTEDANTYYVSYIFNTIALEGSQWQDVAREEEMEVSKTDLGSYRDLGVYVTEQLKQKVSREIALLRDTQEIERKQVTEKVVVTAYSGLVGAFISDSTETLPGYSPVVVVQNGTENGLSEGTAGHSSSNTQSRQASSSSAPHIQIFGNNPARIPVGTRYADLGALVSDDKDTNLWLMLLLDGYPVEAVSIDTSLVSTRTVSYSATDGDGNTTVVERIVEVYDPAILVDIASTTEEVATTTEQQNSI